MAEFRFRIRQNVPGKFYVDDQCIYCDLCREMVPSVFREERESGWASVFHQPSTPEEFQLAMEAVDSCPVEAIGSDGDLHDWSIPPEASPADLPILSEPERPWWKFWQLHRRSPNHAMQRTAGSAAIYP